MKLNIFLLLGFDVTTSLLVPTTTTGNFFLGIKSKSNDFLEEENEAVVIQKIVDALEHGEDDHLINAGLKLTRLAESPKDYLRLQINDSQVRERILGTSLSVEEEEVANAIGNASGDIDDSLPSVDSSLTRSILSELEIGSNFISERQKEAKLLLDKIIVDPNKDVPNLPTSHKDDQTFEKLEKSPSPDETVGENFMQLLRTSMDVSKKGADEETVKETMDMISEGDFMELDVRSIVGDALSSLSEELGIDIQNEMVKDKNASLRLQEIVATSMEELTKSMTDLDSQSALLYSKLDVLQDELKKGTESFEEEKKMELDELLKIQKKFQKDLDVSQDIVQSSTSNLSNTLENFEKSGDFITALALFPFKSVDKKLCFVLGLALLFKVPFDASYYFSIREIDVESMVVLLGQISACIFLFGYYGISFPPWGVGLRNAD